MNCQYCNRDINNKGSLKAHEMSCISNPNKIKHKHSDKSGAQKGSTPWNVGKTDPDKIRERIISVVENKQLSTYSEPAARRTAKAYLIIKNGHQCSMCGTIEWMGKPVPLVCDHISGNSSDNEIENFRLVCCNCDAQLPTFKSKNRGNGRSYDRNYRRKQVAKKLEDSDAGR
jgi:hypothetical protein